VKNEDSEDAVDEEMAATLKQFDIERLSHI